MLEEALGSSILGDLAGMLWHPPRPAPAETDGRSTQRAAVPSALCGELLRELSASAAVCSRLAAWRWCSTPIVASRRSSSRSRPRASHAYAGLGHESRERRDDEKERRPHDEAEHDAGREHADVVHPLHSSGGSGRKPGPRGQPSLARSGGFDCPVGSGRLGVSRTSHACSVGLCYGGLVGATAPRAEPGR